MPRLARSAALVAVVAASGVVAVVFALPWYEHTASGDDRNGWAALPEAGVELALSAVAGTVALTVAIRGARTPRLLGYVGVVATAVLLGLLGFRLAAVPTSLPLPASEYTRGPGPAAALAAAAVMLLALLTAAVAASAKRCPDCAEPVERSADDCPHCGHKFHVSKGWQRCLECGGKIRAEARVCKHCGHEIPRGLAGLTRTDEACLLRPCSATAWGSVTAMLLI